MQTKGERGGHDSESRFKPANRHAQTVRSIRRFGGLNLLEPPTADSYRQEDQVLSRSCQDLPQILAVYLTLRTFLHVLLRLLECKDWRSRKEGVSGLEAWKRGMAGEERHGLEAWAWQLGMGLRHGLEDGLGLRHGLEAWGREGWLGLRHGGEGWLGLSNGKKRYSVGLESRSQQNQTISHSLAPLGNARLFEIF